MKRKILMLSLLLCSGVAAMALSKPEFSLSGKIKGKKTGYIYLNYADGYGKYIKDSVLIRNEAFQFQGKLAEPTMASLQSASAINNSDDPNLAYIFIGPGTMTAEVTAGHFKKIVLKGSVSQDEYEALEKIKEPVRKLQQPFIDAYMKEKNHEKAAEIREKFEPFDEQMKKIDNAFFKSHPDSYVTAYFMQFSIQSLTAAEAAGYYDNWTERIRNSSYGKRIAEEIRQLKNGSPGSVASVFKVKDINGETLGLADFKGKKYVLLDFWASWCVPCRKGNPHLISLYHKYKDRGLEIIGVASDDGAEAAWKKAVEKDQIGIWKHVLSGLKRTPSGYDKSESISEPYGIHTLPTKILIDKEGIIIGRYGGGGESDEALDQKMEEIFK